MGTLRSDRQTESTDPLGLRESHIHRYIEKFKDTILHYKVTLNLSRPKQVICQGQEYRRQHF